MANVILVEFQVQLNRTQIAYWPPVSGDLVRGFIPNGTGYIAGGSYPQEDVDALLTGVTTTPPVIPPSTTTVVVTDNSNGSMTVDAGAGGVQTAIRPIWELTAKSVPDAADQIVVLDINGNLLRSPISGLPAGGGSTTIVDGLSSTSATAALSANQGRVLNTSIGSLSSSLSALSSTVSGLSTSLATSSGSGITKGGGGAINLGGSLNAATTITTTSTFTLALAGLVSNTTPNTVVTMGAGGVLQTTPFSNFTGGGGSSTPVFQGSYASPLTGTIAVSAGTTDVIAASGATITALAPASHPNRVLTLKIAGTGSVNTSTWNIDGSTGRSLNVTDQAWKLTSDGTTWVRG
jgi:hypothetical protein